MIIINGTKYKSKICNENSRFFFKDVELHNDRKYKKIKITDNETGEIVNIKTCNCKCVEIIDIFESENIIVIKVFLIV